MIRLKTKTVVVETAVKITKVYCHATLYISNKQGDHSPDTLKFPDISLTMCGTHAHVKWYS